MQQRNQKSIEVRPKDSKSSPYVVEEQKEISQKIVDRSARWWMAGLTKNDKKKQRKKFARFFEVFTNSVGRDGRYYLNEIRSDPAFLVLVANSGEYLSPGFRDNLHVLKTKRPGS